MANRCKERWGVKTVDRINQEGVSDIPSNIRNRMNIPRNTMRTQKNVWAQFAAFCTSRQYQLTAETSVECLATILEDWAFNMKKSDGEDYKESVVKTMWNIAAKLVQEKYFNQYQQTFNPFKDIMFKAARDARDAKRRELHVIPEKRRLSAVGFTPEELDSVQNLWDEETPVGLQRKFYHLAATELHWKGGDGAWVLLDHFIVELDESGNETGRIEYNSSFSKTTPGSVASKWLTSNNRNPNQCPVRLFQKLKERRPPTVTSNRLFLTPNPFWKIAQSKAWYKNMPIGRYEIAKWTKEAAEKIGIDTKKRKITNQSTAIFTRPVKDDPPPPQQLLSKIHIVENCPVKAESLDEEVLEITCDSDGDSVETCFSPEEVAVPEDHQSTRISVANDGNETSIVKFEMPEQEVLEISCGSDEDSIETCAPPAVEVVPHPVKTVPEHESTRISDSSENSTVKIEIPQVRDNEGDSIPSCLPPPRVDVVLLQTLVDKMPTSVVSNQNFVCESARNILNIAPTSATSGTALADSLKAPRVVFNNCTFNIQSFNCSDLK